MQGVTARIVKLQVLSGRDRKVEIIGVYGECGGTSVPEVLARKLPRVAGRTGALYRDTELTLTNEYDPASPNLTDCSADEGGNLHVRAPADAKVTTQSTDDPTVEIETAPADPYAAASYQMPRPQRPMSRSLGFIGDAPLTQQPNHGGRYSYGAHDDIIGPHRHTASHEWSHGPPVYNRSYNYGYSGPRGGYWVGPRW